jgi:hypothetical protein
MYFNAGRRNPLLDMPASAVKRPGVAPASFVLDEGPVTLSAPSVLSPESYQDLADRIEIWLRGLKRRSDAEAAIKQ